MAIKEMRKKNAWGNLQSVEKVHRVLKEAYEKEKTAWARVCIKKGQLLFKEEPGWEAERDQGDNNWDFTYFAKGYSEVDDAFNSDGDINGGTDAWFE